MSWQQIITYEFLWLGLAVLGLAAGIGILEFFSNLFGDDDNE